MKIGAPLLGLVKSIYLNDFKVIPSKKFCNGNLLKLCTVIN